MGNEKQYCTRMRRNIYTTTKALIPGILETHSVKSLVDVGVADGSFTEYIAKNTSVQKIEAIEPHLYKPPTNPKISITYAKFDNFFSASRYDAVMFSSVMHEISSYCEDEKLQFTRAPIFSAVKRASSLLNPGGIIVIRDMIKPKFRGKRIALEFRTPSIAQKFLDFITRAPYLKRQDSSIIQFLSQGTAGKLEFSIREDVLLEFLMCCTWGEESFTREVNERKFILDKQAWTESLLNNSFKIETFLTTTEEYPKYFDKLVTIKSPHYTYPATTCLIVGRKP